MRNPPTVFIPAAGLGKRVGSQRKHLPKPIISIGDKPLIYRIMSLYPASTEFIIGLGYQGEWVKQVAELTASTNSQKVSFFTTDSWRTKNQGLSHTLYQAKEYLHSDFVFHAVDTLISKDSCLKILNSTNNTLVFSEPNTSGIYRTIIEKSWSRIMVETNEKKSVYIGLAFIKNEISFWESIQEKMNENPEGGETLGVNPLFADIIEIKNSEWLDCGSEQGIQIARSTFKSGDVVLEKSNEAIWKIKDQMYKFHGSETFITNRILRSNALQPFVPNSELVSPNIYKYVRAPGIMLSDVKPEVFQRFLQFCLKFWFSELNDSDFLDLVKDKYDFKAFYFNKTKDRVAQYLAINPKYKPKTINGVIVSEINETIKSLPWREVLSIHPCRAHGDLHPENVVYDESTGQFTLLDWRQDIAGSSLKMGDLYYEMGKIKHGLMVDHGLVSQGRFEIETESENYKISIDSLIHKNLWMTQFEDFITVNKFDSYKVDIMTGLIFINIAALHHSRYNDFLFTLGHLILTKSLHAE